MKSPALDPTALPKPRNPFVAAAHQRAAGRHGGGSRQQRQLLKTQLRQHLRHELPDRPAPVHSP